MSDRLVSGWPNPKERFVFVTPVLEGRDSMSLDEAKRHEAAEYFRLLPASMQHEVTDVLARGAHRRLV